MSNNYSHNADKDINQFTRYQMQNTINLVTATLDLLCKNYKLTERQKNKLDGLLNNIKEINLDREYYGSPAENTLQYISIDATDLYMEITSQV